MSLVTDVQTLINDTNVFWTSQQVYDALNEAQIDLLARTKYVLTTATLGLASGNDIVPIPPTLMIPQKIVYGNIEWYPTTLVELEQYTRSWRAEGLGQPKWFVVWDAGHFRVWPRPDTTYDMTVIGVGWPAEISGTTLNITAPERYRDAVAAKAAAILFEATRPDLSQAYEAECEEAIQTFNKTNRNHLLYRLRRLRPGTVYTQAQGGSIQMGKGSRIRGI